MELIDIFLPIVAWFLIIAALSWVAYMITAFMTIAFLNAFLPPSYAEDNTLGENAARPFRLIWNVGNAVRAVLAIPWRLRRKTVFTGVFDFRPSGLFHQTKGDQISTEKKLRELARQYQQACDNQERARGSQSDYSTSYDRGVKGAKKQFWDAYKLAVSLGFEVKDTWRGTLPEVIRKRLSVAT